MANAFKDADKMLQGKVSRQPPFGNMPYVWEKLSPQQKGKREVIHGLCRSCMAGECSTLVYLEDGVVVKIEGNPEAPPNYGVMCGKGLSELMNLYNPYRVKTPLVRTNPEKGLDVDPMWQEVTWDEALDIVAERLKKVREKDPRGLAIFEGFGQRDTILRAPFTRAFGTPNLIGSHGPLCADHFATCTVHGGFPVAVADLEYCQYHITLGRSIGPNSANATGTRRFARALERGMKLVVVDPRSSCEAAKGEWVPIIPGTDLAFLLAMAHVIMHENLQYDVWFVKNRTNAPYLIASDGYYHRDPKTGKPMMWDSKENKAKPFNDEFKDIALEGTYTVNSVECRTAFDLVKEEFAKYTPEWAENICTVPAKTTRRLAREFIENARIGSTIEIDGFTFPSRPVTLNSERQLVSHRGGTIADLTGKIINMLVGNIEVPGGILSNGYRGPILTPDEDGVVQPIYEAIPKPFKFPPDRIESMEFYPHGHTAPHLAAMAILEPGKYYHDYQIEAMLVIGGNPVRKNTQPQKYVEAFKKVPFVVAISYQLDEPAILADVVLPDHCGLERLRLTYIHAHEKSLDRDVNGLHMVQLREPVPALFNTKNADDIFTELAERLGILYGEGGIYDIMNHSVDPIKFEDGLNLTEGHKLDINTKHVLEEIWDRQLRGWKYNSEGWGLDDLKKTGFLAKWDPPRKHYNYYYFPGNKTRHPFYFERVKRVGDELRANLAKNNITFPGIDDMDYVFDQYRPVPHWVENSEFRAPPEYDLWLINWMTPYFTHDSSGSGTGNPWLAELYTQDPYDGVLLMNTATAERKRLKDGDTVFIESRYGKTEASVCVTELIHPQVVGISGCYGLGTLQSNPLLRRGPNYNALLPLNDESLDALSAGQESAPRVKVYKKGEK